MDCLLCIHKRKKTKYLFFILSLFILMLTSCNNLENTLTDNTYTDEVEATTDVYMQDNNNESKIQNESDSMLHDEIIRTISNPRTSGTLSISAVSAYYMDAAIEGFKSKYPDIDIIIDTYDPEKDGNWDNYLMRLNTQLLSGEGGDIISGISVHRYAEKGIFTDLIPYLNNDSEINMEDFYPEIFNAYKMKEKLLEIPIMVCIPALSFNLNFYTGESLPSGRAWNYKEALDLGQNIYDSSKAYSVVYEVPGYVIFQHIIKNDAEKFINLEEKQVYFDTSEFKDLLNYCKKLGDGDYVPKDGGDDIVNGEIVLRYGDFISNSNAIIHNKLGAVYISEKRPISNSDGKLVIDSYQSISMNSNSKNKDLAWLFIKYLLSEEYQTSPSIVSIYMPIHRKAVPAAVRERAKMDADWFKQSKDATYLYNEEKINEHIQLINDWYSMPMKHCTISNIYLSVVSDEAYKFFDAVESADTIANTLQQKISKMLGE